MIKWGLIGIYFILIFFSMEHLDYIKYNEYIQKRDSSIYCEAYLCGKETMVVFDCADRSLPDGWVKVRNKWKPCWNSFNSLDRINDELGDR